MNLKSKSNGGAVRFDYAYISKIFVNKIFSKRSYSFTNSISLSLMTTVMISQNGDTIRINRDFVEVNDVTYRKLYELKVVTQPVKIIRTSDPFKPKIEGCE